MEHYIHLPRFLTALLLILVQTLAGTQASELVGNCEIITAAKNPQNSAIHKFLTMHPDEGLLQCTSSDFQLGVYAKASKASLSKEGICRFDMTYYYI